VWWFENGFFVGQVGMAVGFCQVQRELFVGWLVDEEEEVGKK
jgi:hypothetical protein